jgi:hypothetical protein
MDATSLGGAVSFRIQFKTVSQSAIVIPVPARRDVFAVNDGFVIRRLVSPVATTVGSTLSGEIRVTTLSPGNLWRRPEKRPNRLAGKTNAQGERDAKVASRVSISATSAVDFACRFCGRGGIAHVRGRAGQRAQAAGRDAQAGET